MSIAEDLAIYTRTISDDIEHGASHLLKIAAGSLRTALKKNSDATPLEIVGASREYAVRLSADHRRMAPILNFSNGILLTIEASKDNESEIRDHLLDFSLKVMDESTDAIKRVAAHADNIISGNGFMTHSRSSTLLHFLTHIRRREELSVYVTQSRPGGEGRLLAGELSVAGVRTILFEDSEVMRYLGRVSAVIVGTDAIIPSGVVNKVGTHMISLAAREVGIPIYCLTESMKIWPFDEPVLEGLAKGVPSPLGGFEFFEFVPGNVFDRIILESGPVTFEEIVLRADEFQIAAELRRFTGM